jgi:hypothetical protein
MKGFTDLLHAHARQSQLEEKRGGESTSNYVQKQEEQKCDAKRNVCFVSFL